MPDLKISDLPASPALIGTEPVPIDVGSTTYRTTTGAIAALGSLLQPSGDVSGVTDRTNIEVALGLLPDGSDPSGGLLLLAPGEFFLDAELQNLNKVVIRGQGRSATKLKAGTAWAAVGSKTALVAIGSRAGGASPIFGCRFEEMTLDCDSQTNAGCYSNQANEMSGLRNVVVVNPLVVGVDYASGCQNVRCNDDLEIFLTDVPSGAVAAGLRMVGVAGQSRIDSVTLVGNSSDISSQPAILIDSSAVQIGAIHTEAWEDGIRAQNGSSVSIDSIGGATSVTNIVHVEASNNEGQVTARAVRAGSAGSIAVLDDLRGITYLASQVEFDTGRMRSNRPGKCALAVMSSDVNGSSATTPTTMLSVSFRPSGTICGVRMSGTIAQGISGELTFLQITGNATSKPVASLNVGSTQAAKQMNVGGCVRFTGLTPGDSYTFDLQFYNGTGSGVTYCRPSAHPDLEQMSLEAFDVIG